MIRILLRYIPILIIIIKGFVDNSALNWFREIAAGRIQNKKIKLLKVKKNDFASHYSFLQLVLLLMMKLKFSSKKLINHFLQYPKRDNLSFVLDLFENEQIFTPSTRIIGRHISFLVGFHQIP